jgi:hypothetical protein
MFDKTCKDWIATNALTLNVRIPSTPARRGGGFHKSKKTNELRLHQHGAPSFVSRTSHLATRITVVMLNLQPHTILLHVLFAANRHVEVLPYIAFLEPRASDASVSECELAKIQAVRFSCV